MSKIVRRGYMPEDEKFFDGEQKKSLNKAAEELLYLLNRGYKVKSASTFIGNHYMLSERQRLALTRMISSSEAVARRLEKQVNPTDECFEVHIDGFNTIITLEVALSKSPVLRCMDETIRDLAGLRGTYRIIDKTEIAITYMFQWLTKRKIQKANIYLDAPVSNSGRLKTLLEQFAVSYDVELTVFIEYDVDRRLEQLANVISSDAIILDKCISWLNMNKEILEDTVEDVWYVENGIKHMSKR